MRTFWHKQASSPLPLVAAKKTIIDHTSKEPAPLCSISIFVVMPHITSVLLHQWQNCSSFSSSFHKKDIFIDIDHFSYEFSTLASKPFKLETLGQDYPQWIYLASWVQVEFYDSIADLDFSLCGSTIVFLQRGLLR